MGHISEYNLFCIIRSNFTNFYLASLVLQNHKLDLKIKDEINTPTKAEKLPECLTKK